MEWKTESTVSLGNIKMQNVKLAHKKNALAAAM